MSSIDLFDSDLDEEVEINETTYSSDDSYSISQDSLVDLVLGNIEIADEHARIEEELHRDLIIRQHAYLYIALVGLPAVYYIINQLEPRVVVFTTVILVPVYIAVGYIPDHLPNVCRCTLCTLGPFDLHF